MKNKFSSFLTQKGRWLTAILFLLTFSIGQMWADSVTFSAADMSEQTSGAKKGKITVYCPTKASEQQAYKSGSATKYNAISLGSSADTAVIVPQSGKSVQFRADANYKITGISIFAAANKDSICGEPIVIWTGAVNHNPAYVGTIEAPSRAGTSDPDPIVVTGIPNNTTAFALYRRIKYNSTTGEIGTGSNFGRSQQTWNIFSVTVTYEAATPSCDDPETALSLSSDAAATVYVGDEITFSTSGGNGGTVAIAGAASETISDGKWIATEGEHTFTASQAKNGNVCAQEDELVLTVNPKTPVTSVSVAGVDAGYLNDEVTFTATAEYASSYRWTIDGVAQSSTTATMSFTPTTAGEYSIICEARNDFNDPGEWIASSTHTFTASKLCGELIKIVQNGQSDGIVSGILTGTKDVKLSSGTSDYDEKTGRKIGSNDYWLGVKELSKPLRAGDVATIFVTTVSAKLQLFSDKGTTLIGEMDGGVVQGENEIVLNSSATGKTAIYLYRTSTAGSDMNPFVHSLSVSRSCIPSTDCSISDVTINSESVTPVSKVFSYEVPAASALTEVAVTYSTHPLATASPASGFTVAVPAAGDPANTQTITVTAEDGTHSDTYTISVSKATAASDVVTLDALAVTGYTLSPTFDAATLAYTITKGYGTEDPTADKVTYTKSEEAQHVDVVYDGTNHKFVVTVTAEDNTTTQDYEITINEAEAPKNLSRVLFSNGFDAFIDNTNHTVKAYYLAGTSAPTATTITAGAGTAGELAEGKITVTGDDASSVDYTVTLEAVTPNTTAVAEEAEAGEFAGNEAWVKNGLLIYGTTAGYDSTNKRYTNRRLKRGTDAEDDQRVIAGWVRSYFFVGNASKFIMTISGNKNLDYAIDGGTPVENVNVETLEIALTKGNHMIEIVSHQTNGDCYMSAPKLVELPPTFTVNYYPNGGSGAEIIVDDDASVVAEGSIFTAPASSIFAGWNTQADGNGVAYAPGAAVTENLTLHAQWQSYFTITYMDGETELDTEDVLEGDAPVGISDPAKIGYDFAGWTLSGSDEVIDVTALSASTSVYAKWTAFDGCTLWYPATSGDALNVGDNVDMLSGSFGANVAVVGMKTEGSSIAYDARGLLMGGGSGDIISVTLNNDMDIDTKISVTLDAKAGSRARGLYLLNGTGGSVKGGTLLGWNTPGDDVAEGEIETFSYTVEDADGLAGTNVFRLKRQNSTYIKCIKVESCGAAIVYHNLTSAVDPAGKGTVTLGASSVREGYTTTAEYSAIDPLYEFVSWSVSGAGASVENATANPATITVGTADAVVTLNLQLIPVKFTVNYYDGETPMGSELVAVNENPTASEINTNKRHYTFQGWSETDGGSVVALNTITRTEATTVNLYAKYEPVACPTSGYLFSLESDEAKRPAEKVKAAKNGGEVDLADYATISGGAARIINDETGSDKDAVGTDGKFLLTATKEVMKIELNCAIATGDVIRIPDNNQKYVLSTSNSKTGTYQAQTSSQHEFEATAAWNGVDDLYILYDGSSLNFTKVYVLRPYTVSFDLQGHGDAIDVQKLVEGKKVVAPTAPTADGWDFGGWYKEAACTNAWDFDDDVVEGNMSLFAKWDVHVTNDATLKSLKYGTTTIALVDGIYSYDVELAASVAAVPALSAETNAELATKVITNAEAFVAGQATSTVLVTAEDGETQLTYTVNFTKAAAVDLVDVTGNMTWDFSKANDGSAASSNLCNDEILANVAGIVNNSDFESDNIKATANKFASGKLQASMIKFHTTVDGMIKVVFSNTGSKTSDRYLTVNGRKTDKGSRNGTAVTYTGFVYAGDVELGVVEGDGNMLNFTSVDFKATVDYPRTVNPNNIGTLCWTNNAVLGGATLYQLAGKNASNYLVFDEVAENRLEAGKPYIFVPENGNTEIKVYNTDEEPALVQADLEAVNGMKGTFEPLTTIGTAEGEGELWYKYIISNNHYVYVDYTNCRLGAYRAYITSLDDISPAPEQVNGTPRRRLAIGGKAPQNPTGLDELNAADAPIKVMINGELFILRGEKMYDATGRLVK